MKFAANEPFLGLCVTWVNLIHYALPKHAPVALFFTLIMLDLPFHLTILKRLPL